MEALSSGALANLASVPNIGALPVDTGLVAWSFDPALINTSQILTAQRYYQVLLWVNQAVLASNLVLSIPAGGAGVGLANSGAALYSVPTYYPVTNANGVLLPSDPFFELDLIVQAQPSGNPDISALLQAAGTVIIPLPAPQALTPGYAAAVFWVSTAATLPTLESGIAQPLMANLNASARRFGATPTGGPVTNPPARLFGSGAEAPAALWVGVS